LAKAKKEGGELMGEFSVSKNVDMLSGSATAIALDLFYTVSVDEAVVANPCEQTVLEAWQRAKPVRCDAFLRSRCHSCGPALAYVPSRVQKLLHDAVMDMTSVIREVLTEATLSPVQSKFLASSELKVRARSVLGISLTALA
jgi:hypothetical protein